MTPTLFNGWRKVMHSLTLRQDYLRFHAIMQKGPLCQSFFFSLDGKDISFIRITEEAETWKISLCEGLIDICAPRGDTQLLPSKFQEDGGDAVISEARQMLFECLEHTPLETPLGRRTEGHKAIQNAISAFIPPATSFPTQEENHANTLS